MWRHIACSLQGTAHLAEALPCQDASRVVALGSDGADAWAACVADGAGSAVHSAEGSRIACDTTIAAAVAYFDHNASFSTFEREEALRWCDEARQAMSNAAAERESDLREFATTLCVALVSPQRSVFFQIGDGAIVLRRQRTYGAVFWPQSGEYANSTNFLTGTSYAENLEYLAIAGPNVDVALMTDGVERLALDFQGRTPHVPFFDPLFSALRANPDRPALEQSLEQFLNSEPVTSRSDDDKSLILASRIEAAHA